MRVELLDKLSLLERQIDIIKLPTFDDHLPLITSMVSSNRRRSSRAAAIPTVPLPIPQEAPSVDTAVENIVQPSDASTTGDSDSANPPSLPDPSVAATDVAAHLSIASNPSPNLAPGVGRGNPLQFFSQPSSAPSGAVSADLAISQAGEVSVEHQQLPQQVDGVLLEPAPLPPAPSSLSSTLIFATAINTDTANITADTSTLVPVVVPDVLPLSALSAAVLPANSVQTDSLLLTRDSNVMNSNVQSVATFATIGGATNDVGGSNFMARYLIPREKVRKLSKVPTHLEVFGITNDLRKVGCPFTFLDVVPLDVEQYLVTLLQRGYCTDIATRDECEDCKNWSTERFCTELLKAVPDESIDTPLGQTSFLGQVSSFNFRFDLNKIEIDTQNDTALVNLVANFPSTTAEEQLKAVKIQERQLPTHPVNWQLILRCKVNDETVPINDLKIFESSGGRN